MQKKISFLDKHRGNFVYSFLSCRKKSSDWISQNPNLSAENYPILIPTTVHQSLVSQTQFAKFGEQLSVYKTFHTPKLSTLFKNLINLPFP
jgi:hypothetical protein